MNPQVFTIRTEAFFGSWRSWYPERSISWAIEDESTVFLAQPSEMRWNVFGSIIIFRVDRWNHGFAGGAGVAAGGTVGMMGCVGAGVGVTVGVGGKAP